MYEHRNEYSNPVRPPAGDTGDDRSTCSGPTTRRAARPGELTYAMNTRDLQDNLRSIKNGKEYADFMIATIHAHQGDSILQSFLFEDHPPDFLVELAHKSIDNGADAFVGHGPHVLRGIEIYKGKPIFYDLGEFFREWDWSCDCNFSPNGDVTQAENVVRGLEARGVVEPINYESAIAVSRFDKGQLQEVRVYPIWASHDGPLSRRGLPMTAPPPIAQRILQRLQKLSEPFGTKIAIDGNVGVIRVTRFAIDVAAITVGTIMRMRLLIFPFATLAVAVGAQQAAPVRLPAPEPATGGISAGRRVLQWPLPAAGQAYADIDGRHLHRYVVDQAAISRRYRDQGHPQFWGRITGTSADAESATGWRRTSDASG